MDKIDYFDKLYLLKIIGRKVRSIATKKGYTLSSWAELLKGTTHGDLSNILNGKKGISSEKLIQITSAIGITTKQLDEIVKEAKKEELRIYYGEDLEIIPNGNINTLENIDFDNEELLKVMFKREFGKELSDHDRDEILNFIKFKANK